MTPSSDIKLDVRDGVATILFDRPTAMNAFTSQMVDDFLDAIERVDADDAVRAVVVTGAGRGFCAGADLSGGADTFERSAVGEAFRDGAGVITLRLLRARKPFIAAINGAAVGFGASLTLAMDVRLAADTAKFGFVFTRRGIVPDGASSWFLPRLVGPAQAAEWMLTGRLFGAADALRGNLVAALHPLEELLPAAHALAQEIAENCSPVSVAMTRRMLWRSLSLDHPMEAHRRESEALQWCGVNADAKEGVSAFLEKRAPNFPMQVSADLPPFFDLNPEPAFGDEAVGTR